jgi:cyclic pyranopterin phosphate synthase
MDEPLDRLSRPLRDLRISVTDLCNFRCGYCMPREIFGADHVFMPRRMLLSFEEIERVARAAVTLGVRKIRLTGGEPLLRKELHALVAKLAAIDGLEDLAVTTNGVLLGAQAARLKAAGLKRVSVSLDSLDEATFQRIADTRMTPARVLAGIDAAAHAGLGPVKINMVVKRGMNEADIVPMAAHFRHSGHVLRFIEFMDVGSSNRWQHDEVVTADQILARLDACWPLEPIAPRYAGEVARRYRYRDGGGEIGLIASVSKPFCRGCTRLRLAADGKTYTCLFAHTGHDLRALLREGISDARLEAELARIWMLRADRYSELRAQQARETASNRIEMSYIGG